MSTLSRFRKPSSVQFIDTIEDLISHTTKYLKRLPKSDRFIWVTDLCSLVKRIGIECISANAIKEFKIEQDFANRRDHLQKALGYLNALDFYLTIVAKDEEKYKAISKGSNDEDYPFIRWGELIEKERGLIKGVLKKDEMAFFKK